MSEPVETAFDRYMKFMIAESELEDAVIEAFGGLGSLPFHNWWFDYYDRSVELSECAEDFIPLPEQLDKLREVGIAKAYVSYPSGRAACWYMRNGWQSGPCLPKGCDSDRRGLVAKLYAKLAETQQALEEVRKA